MTCALIDGAKSSAKSSTKSSVKYFTLLFIAHLAAESADGRQRKNSGRISDEHQNSAQGRTSARYSPNQSPQFVFMCRPVIIKFSAMRDR
jgi:hypothetical protein